MINILFDNQVVLLILTVYYVWTTLLVMYIFFSMAHLLTKFRLEYFSLKMVSISDKPQDSTISFFNQLITHVKKNNGNNDKGKRF